MEAAVFAALLWFPGLTIFLVGAAFSFIVGRLRSRARLPGLLAMWLVCSTGLGYLWYRATCAQGLTCDVGGVRYWLVLVPRYTWLWASALGLASLGAWLSRRRLAGRAAVRHLLLGGAGAVVGFLLAAALLAGYHRVTCGSRPMRRLEDGSIGTECELYSGLSNESLLRTSVRGSSM
jgi:hypothetical protein